LRCRILRRMNRSTPTSTIPHIGEKVSTSGPWLGCRFVGDTDEAAAGRIAFRTDDMTDRIETGLSRRERRHPVSGSRWRLTRIARGSWARIGPKAKAPKNQEDRKSSKNKNGVVARRGIEPPTRGFSVRCSRWAGALGRTAVALCAAAGGTTAYELQESAEQPALLRAHSGRRCARSSCSGCSSYGAARTRSSRSICETSPSVAASIACCAW
jgi:hypothetical protein